MTQNALVTGADRGLGQGLTAGLLARGWQVFAGQYLPDWPELGQLKAQYPDLLHLVPLDVGSIESALAAAEAVASLTDRLDVIINNAGVASRTSRTPITEPQDYDEMHRLYNVNALGPLRVVEAFLPLVGSSEMKRLCFVSSEAGSIGQAQRTAWYAYCMSKAALNMGVKLMYNHLRPEGYTFRLYHPGWVRSYMGGKKNPDADLEPEVAAAYALPFFLDARADEDRLVLRDYLGREWPF
ncbi:MAG: SDR family NAD(P)-dependent oxidoreductase [Anaerolineae bacterium]|nr:SDR family NAD(P)-dependent oxidoreductase [Anaerolineae bacterium]